MTVCDWFTGVNGRRCGKPASHVLDGHGHCPQHWRLHLELERPERIASQTPPQDKRVRDRRDYKAQKQREYRARHPEMTHRT